MNALRRSLTHLGAVVALAALACASPEAARSRGTGRGADLGNRGAVVEMHGGSVIYYDTPCLMPREECTAPSRESQRTSPASAPGPTANERRG